jgi:alpha-1,2-mannosyltransferase
LGVGGLVAGVVLLREYNTVDLLVYRAAGSSVVDHVSPYTDLVAAGSPVHFLLFTYPPFAALLFVPLAELPLTVARTIVAVGTVTLLVWTGGRFVSDDDGSPGPWGRRSRWLVAGALVAGILCEPVREELTLGQVDVALTALAVADCLGWLPRLPRGMGVGVAAAVKLTPAAFVAFFVIRREPRPVVTAATTFVAASSLALVAGPSDVWRYWTVLVFDTGRVGNLSYAANQSLRGAIERLGVDGTAATTAWLLAALVVGTVALVAAARWHAAGDDRVALLVIATAALVVAPVAWSHHWILIGPALCLLASRVRRRRDAAALATITAIFIVGPHWLLSSNEDPTARWSPVQSLLGDAYLWIALGFLVWAAAVVVSSGQLAVDHGADAAPLEDRQ